MGNQFIRLIFGEARKKKGCRIDAYSPIPLLVHYADVQDPTYTPVLATGARSSLWYGRDLIVALIEHLVTNLHSNNGAAVLESVRVKILGVDLDNQVGYTVAVYIFRMRHRLIAFAANRHTAAFQEYCLRVQRGSVKPFGGENRDRNDTIGTQIDAIGRSFRV